MTKKLTYVLLFYSTYCLLARQARIIMHVTMYLRTTNYIASTGNIFPQLFRFKVQC